MTVLIAEDDPVTRLLLEEMLAEMGHASLTVADGNLALETVRKNPDINLVLLDWELPVMDGGEICRAVKELERFVYIIMVTSKSGTKNLVQCIEAGADDFVSKPFSVDELKVRIMAGQRILHHENRMAKHANYDELTGIWNRRMILHFMENEWWRAQREEGRLSVMVIDIDHFKPVNDTYGHHAGDLVLIQFAQIVAANVRPYDQFGRYGGEEFLLVMPLSVSGDAKLLAERLRESIEEAEFSVGSEQTIKLTASIGLAQKSPSDRTPNDTFKRADECVYRAKTEGRNRVIMSAEQH